MILIDLTKRTEFNIPSKFKVENGNVIYCLKEIKCYYDTKYRNLNIEVIDDELIDHSLLKKLHGDLYEWALNTKINDKNVFQYLQYNDIPSIYWLLDHWHLFISILEYYTLIHKVKHIIKRHKDVKIIILCPKGFTGSVKSEFSSLNLQIVPVKDSFIQKFRYVVTSTGTIIYGIALFFGLPPLVMLRKLAHIYLNKGRLQIKQRDILFFSPAFHFIKQPNGEYIDKVLQPWLKTIKKKGTPFWYTDMIDFSGFNLTSLKNKTRENDNYLPLERFFGIREFYHYVKGAISIFKRLKKVLYRLKKSSILNNAFPLEIKIEFKKTMWIFPFMIAYYETVFKKLVTEIKPRYLLMCSESGFIGRIFGTIIKANGGKQTGIQHGLLTGSIDYPYFHIKSHINNNDYTNAEGLPQYCPIPNITAVWTEKIRSMLINNSCYPSESITIIGNPNLSFFSKDFSLLKKTEIIEKYGIPENKTLLLFAIRTGGKGHTIDFDIDCLNSVYQIPLQYNNYFVLCKLHGLESKKMHSDVYRQLKLNSQQALITRDIDIKTAIRISDVVVSVRSTTIYEAMAMGKPVIIINPGNMDLDAVDIGKSGGVFYATNTEELMEHLNTINNESMHKSMVEKQNRLVLETLGDARINYNDQIEKFIDCYIT